MTKQFALQSLAKAKKEGYTHLYYTDTEGYEVAIQRDNFARSAEEAQLALAADNNYCQDRDLDDKEIIESIGNEPWAFWTSIDEAIKYVNEDLQDEEE